MFTPSSAQKLRRLLYGLRDKYGPLGWWPVRSERTSFQEPLGSRETLGYHPGEYNYPRSPEGRWEIAAGAILTQNTAWTNVEKALSALQQLSIHSAMALLNAPSELITNAIRPAGYFNQKTQYLQALAQWFLEHDLKLHNSDHSRNTLAHYRPLLLAVRGVGPETADSILLYAYHLPTFVVDTYTRRLLSTAGLVTNTASYQTIQQLCETALQQSDATSTIIDWQEIHASIVEEGKTRSSASRSAPRRQRSG